MSRIGNALNVTKIYEQIGKNSLKINNFKKAVIYTKGKAEAALHFFKFLLTSLQIMS